MKIETHTCMRQTTSVNGTRVDVLRHTHIFVTAKLNIFDRSLTCFIQKMENCLWFRSMTFVVAPLRTERMKKKQNSLRLDYSMYILNRVLLTGIKFGHWSNASFLVYHRDKNFPLVARKTSRSYVSRWVCSTSSRIFR